MKKNILVKKRNPLAVFLLPFVTFGIYSWYWAVKTKGELNRQGENIPTAWIWLIPVVGGFIWYWKYSQAVENVTHEKMSGPLAFVLLVLLGNVGQAIVQDTYNKLEGSSQTNMNPHPAESKSLRIGRTTIVVILALVGVAIASGAGYYLGIYLPNKPENVFKKAISNFGSKPQGYTITGKIDQGGVNDADFNYTIKTNDKKDVSAQVSASNFIVSPSINVDNVGGKTYVQFSNFLGTDALAKKYRNLGRPGLSESIASFTDKSLVGSNEGKWFDVPNYITDQQKSKSQAAPSNFNKNITPTIGGIETINGQSTRKYTVVITKDTFYDFLSKIDNSSLGFVTGKFRAFASQNGSTDTLSIDIWVNLKSKTIEQATYDGQPFRDATFSFKLIAANNTITTPDKSYTLNSTLSYGIVSDIIFSKDYQQASNEGDKERIADLKGIKTALEIYKAKNGHYPVRYDLSVNQQSFITNQMPGASLEVFKDPSGRFIGLNGSQYSYVPSTTSGDESCSGSGCAKYFIVVTLDDGTKFQLNSD